MWNVFPNDGGSHRYAKIHGTDHRPWLTRLLSRRPTKVAATIGVPTFVYRIALNHRIGRTPSTSLIRTVAGAKGGDGGAAIRHTMQGK